VDVFCTLFLRLEHHSDACFFRRDRDYPNPLVLAPDHLGKRTVNPRVRDRRPHSEHKARIFEGEHSCGAT
jgi:hypothetical protein